MKKALIAIALIASPALAADLGDCRQLATLYEIRSLMMKRYTSSYDEREGTSPGTIPVVHVQSERGPV